MRLCGKLFMFGVAGCVVILFSAAGVAVKAAPNSQSSFSHQKSGNLPEKLECPRDAKSRMKKYMEAYRQLLKVMGTGESGKMDTPEKQKAYETYKFYERCLEKSGAVAADTVQKQADFLVSCHGRMDPARNVITLDLSVKEKEVYESLKRVEISIRSVNGKEFLRAMNNRMSQCAPIPPNAFGLYPVGEKKELSQEEIKDAGMGAAIPAKSRYGNLVKGCRTIWNDGILKVHWLIHPVGWVCPDGQCYVFVKIVNRLGEDSGWAPCCQFNIARKSGMLK